MNDGQEGRKGDDASAPKRRGSFSIPREMSERSVLTICAILTIAIFVLDASLSIGFLVSVLYVIPLLICIWSPRRRTIFLVAGVTSFLTIVVIPHKPPGDILIPLFNRPVSLLVIWTLTILFDLFLTERRRAERALQESQEDLNFAQIVSKTGSWRLDLMTNELLWSDETYHIFGIPRGTPMTYELFLSRIHPDDRDTVDKSWQAALHGAPYDIEHRVIVNGDIVWVQEKAVLEFDKDGALRSGFGTVQDITERKRAREALQDSQQMLQLVLDTIPQRVIWKDRDGRFLGANRAAALDAGLSDPKEMVGLTDHDMAWSGTADLYQADDREIMSSGRPKLDFVEPQLQSDGRLLWIQTSKVPLRDARGNVIGVLVTYGDITERKNLEEALKRSNAELQQFAYVSSHDLQEPLRMIISYLTLLERKYKDKLDAQAQEYIRTAVEGGMRMRALINDLLEYSRIDTMAKPFAPVDMNEVLEAAIENLKVSIEENDADIQAAPLPTIIADRTQMIQVIQNLVGNAIKFRGAERPRIQISATQDAREWTFAVKDNGIGMSPEYKDKIFQMFQRLHSREEYPGTGVGLAIAKKIVEQHGGRIWVESEEGRGSTFYFTVSKARRKERDDQTKSP